MSENWDIITFRDDLSQYRINRRGEILNIFTKNVLRGGVDNNGYKTYTIKTDNGNVIQAKAHRFVALQYIPNNDKTKTIVNHIDEDKTNCNVDNLEWVTPKENANHATSQRRKGTHNSKPINEYTLNGKYLRTWKSARSVKNYYNIDCENAVSNSCKGKQFQAYGRLWRYYNGDTSDIKIPKLTGMKKVYAEKGHGMSNIKLDDDNIPEEYLYKFDIEKEKAWFENHERLTQNERERLKILFKKLEDGKC